MVPLDDQPPVALLVEAADQDLPSRTLLQHVATAVTIELAQLRAGAREPQRGSVLSDLLTGRLAHRDGREPLAQHGLDPARAILIAARRTAPRGAARGVPADRRLERTASRGSTGPRRCHVLVDCGLDPRLDGLAVQHRFSGRSGHTVHIARQARELTVFQCMVAYAAPGADWTARPGVRSVRQGRLSRFSRAQPSHAGGALAASWPWTTEFCRSRQPRGARASFEERSRIGGFALLAAYWDIDDERANAMAAEFVRRQDPRDCAGIPRPRGASPTQTIGCKRLCVDSGGYYGTFNQPHVRLVDVNEAR